jgi:hypothetical protein
MGGWLGLNGIKRAKRGLRILIFLMIMITIFVRKVCIIKSAL